MPYRAVSPLYNLYGVVVHIGSDMAKGHYVSFVRLNDGRWCKCNDETVTVVTEASVLAQKAYMLFYERETLPESFSLFSTEQQVINPQPTTLNPQLSTLNPQPSTLNLQP
jgi:hypothetical protein